MIIKALSKKSINLFGDLVMYFRRDHERELPEAMTYNLMSHHEDLEAVIGEFRANYQDYSKKRKNGIVCMHEILSPHPKDSEKVTNDMLYDLAQTYLEARAPNHLAFCQIHLDIEHEDKREYRPHVHILLSGNELGGGKQVSQRKNDFQEVKEKMKAYTLEQYPQLEHAFQFGKDHEKGLTTDQSRSVHNEKERRKRTRALSDKEKAVIALQTALGKSKSLEELSTALEAHSFSLYQRGKTWGLQKKVETGKSGRKFRLKTLGVLDEYEKRVKEWEARQAKARKEAERRRELAEIRKNQDKEQEQSREIDPRKPPKFKL